MVERWGSDRPLPPATDEIPRHRRKKGKKPWTIEYRYLPGKGLFWSDCRKWRTWGRYETERDRDEALRACAKNSWKERIYMFRPGGGHG